jgi:tripartite-type tricarboxylate transporter receptor subunit TctC
MRTARPVTAHNLESRCPRDTPYIMVGAMDAPFKSVPELLAYAKVHPDTLNFGVPNGAPPHMLALMFRKSTGAAIEVVPYRGASTLTTDMIAGRIVSGVRSPAVGDKLKMLAAEPREMSPEQFGTFITSEYERIGAIIRAAGVTGQ